jgi:hypothetical protein
MNIYSLGIKVMFLGGKTPIGVCIFTFQNAAPFAKEVMHP